jgi:hypothetical protein
VGRLSDVAVRHEGLVSLDERDVQRPLLTGRDRQEPAAIHPIRVVDAQDPPPARNSSLVTSASVRMLTCANAASTSVPFSISTLIALASNHHSGSGRS